MVTPRKRNTFFRAMIVWLFLLLSGPALAQAGKQLPVFTERAAVEQVIGNYYRAFSTVEKSGNKKEVLRYLDKAYLRNLTYVSHQGETQRITENYQSFSRYLDLVVRMYKSSQLFTTITFDSLAGFQLTDQTAKAAFQVQFLLRQGSDTLAVGVSANRFTLKKYASGWKVLSADLVWMEDKVFRPQCRCNLTSTVGQKVYAARLTYPEADRFRNRLIHVRVIDRPDYKLILLDNLPYQWHNGKVHKLTASFTPIELIGTAQTAPEAIVLLLQQDAYAAYCQYGIVLK